MINCKNCNLEINEKDSYCKQCGARVIKKRITLKSLFSNLLTALGWDSNFVISLRYLFYKPQVVLKEYINGTRKKYANPFSFFAIIIAISLFVFNKYSDQLIQMSTDLSINQTEILESPQTNKIEDVEMFGFKNEKEFKQGMMKFQLKYYNLLSFLLLPFYTLISFAVFGKPYNFGEHLVINTYILSITTFIGLLLFILSIIVGVNMYGTGIMLIPVVYYSYAYKKLYKLKLSKLIIKILKFVGILFVLMLIPIAIGFFSAVFNK